MIEHYIVSNDVSNSPFHKTELRLELTPAGHPHFVEAAAKYFIQTWMSSSVDDMMGIWRNWNSATDEDKSLFFSYLDSALLTSGVFHDDPKSYYTAPMASFAETMLRWIRKTYGTDQLIIEPSTPQPARDGSIDMIEIAGLPARYDSLRVTLWEVKSSDSDSSPNGHNSKIYKQLDDYPRRFFPQANAIAETYSLGGYQSPEMLRFLRDMAKHALNRSPVVKYGVLVVCDTSAVHDKLVPNLHKHPKNPEIPSGSHCHHLCIVMIPTFQLIRNELWRKLNLID